MSFDIGSVTARIDADISGFKKGINEAQSSVATFGQKLDNFGNNLKNVGQKLALTSALVGGGLAVFLKGASQEAINLERAMITLEIISGKFGVSADGAKDSAQKLGRELRIGVGAAAEGLQNLLKSGLNLEQATDLMKRFANEASIGKSKNIDLATAVQNLSFAYATGNSALGNMSGISENFINIIEKGREALIKEGVAVADITDEMAKYRGMIDLTNLTMGASERLQGTIIDKQAVYQQSVRDLQVAFGELINPYLVQLMEKLTSLVNWINGLSEENKKLILIIGFVIAAIGPFLIILGTLVSGISAVITIINGLGVAMMFLIANPIALLVIAIAALYFAWKYNFLGIQDQVKALWELIKLKFNEGVEFLKNVGNQIKEAITRPFHDAWNTVQDIMRKIKGALDFTKHNSPSVIDIINNSIREANKALSGLNFNVGLNTPQIAQGIMNTTQGQMVTQVSIDMSNAIVTDEFGAERMGELIGDKIINRLKGNVRF